MSIRVKNDLLDRGSELYWEDSEFTRNNFPSKFDFEIEVKREIFRIARLLPTGYSVIDCGAHIGDLTIPLAGALSDIGRTDVQVFAMDPSMEKCTFLKRMVTKNRLQNVRVINCGLSNVSEIRFPHVPIDGNTGGTCWLHEEINTNSNAHLYNTGESFSFDTLDNLVSTGVIDRPIGLIHLDVENMELFALRGSIKTISNYLPMICLEDHQDDPDPFLDILGTSYRFSHRIQNNSIFLTL